MPSIDRVWRERSTVLTAENEIVILPHTARSQRIDGDGAEGDTPTLARLRRRVARAALGAREDTHHVHRPGIEIAFGTGCG